MEIIKRIIKWWKEESAKQCPHCGYYCNDSSIFCLPPADYDERKK